MVQSGIAYAAGQLLAVVAPRTVLVVDAPTDWSLAGPLWELALDDAPVDEILDVLIRRGIRTAPSFAIVRVETDAVRALVRGSVPVCFERVGEPVRLDATGATTWLEGLISGARRVLVGAVETNSTLPYLVSTGVVLVSGLALPCGPGEPEGRRSLTPALSDAPVEGPTDPPGGYLNSPVPVAAGASGPASSTSSGSSSFAPLAGREPRVVDLTRSEARNAARSGAASISPPRDSRSLASSWSGPERPAGSRPELNGHAPAGFDPLTAPANHPASALDAPAGFGAPSAFAPLSPLESAPTDSDDPGELLDLDEPGRESSSEPGQSQSEPDNRSDSSADFRFAEHVEAEVQPSSTTEAQPDPLTSTESYATPDAYAEPQRFADSPSYPEKQYTERQPYKDPAYPDAQPFNSSHYSSGQQYSSPTQYSSDDSFGSNDLWSSRSEKDQADAEQPAQPDQNELAERAVSTANDDLLRDREDEAPAGPAPTDLPNLAAGSATPEASGFTAADPGQPRSFGGAPAAWPPPSASAADQHPLSWLDQAEVSEAAGADQHSLSWLDQAEVSEAAGAAQLSTFGRAEAEPESHDSASAQEFDPQGLDSQDSAQPPLEDLPLRVRGRSLRPQSGSNAAGA